MRRVYRKLDVKEVWSWRKDKLQTYCLRGERYEPVTQSEVLPGLEPQLLPRFIGEPKTSAALLGFRKALNG